MLLIMQFINWKPISQIQTHITTGDPLAIIETTETHNHNWNYYSPNLHLLTTTAHKPKSNQ